MSKKRKRINNFSVATMMRCLFSLLVFNSRLTFINLYQRKHNECHMVSISTRNLADKQVVASSVKDFAKFSLSFCSYRT